MPMIDLGPAAREVTRLLDGVTEDRMAGPTPCPDYPIAALLDHLMGLSLAFTWAARKTTPTDDGSDESGPGQATAEHLHPQWRTLLPARLDELVQAWRDPVAWQGMTEAGGVRMPAEVMGVVALDELVLHGWDLARATGQDERLDPAAVEAAHAFLLPNDEMLRVPGGFGPAVEPPEGADAQTRLLCFAGRRP